MVTLFLQVLCLSTITLYSCSSNENRTTSTQNSSKQIYEPKITSQEDALIGTKWQLIELMGQTVADSGFKKSGYLVMEVDKKFSASAGCNKFIGVFEQNADMMKIEFKPNMAATLMVCPDQQKENNFKEMLSKVNSYTISENILSLSKNKTAPFARFKSVKE